MASAVCRACSLALFLVLGLTATASAQAELNALRVYLGATGTTCTLHTGSGAPSTSLGAVCDIYLRTDSPYGVYSKTGASTWSEVVRLPGSSSLTTVGALTSGSIASGFGSINIGANAITGGAITGSTSVTTPTLSASGNLTLSPTGDIIINPGGADVLPGVGYTHNIGARTNKFLSLHAGELQVDTLVANSTMATIGGRILVGPTTELTSDVSSGATSIIVKHNQMASGDRVLLEANGALEWMAITSGPSGSGPYTYSVTRDLDGTGANAWVSGDAVFNTGQTGSGYMDLFSLGSSVFVGHSAVFNYDAALNAYSSNYFETDVWSPFGDAANNTVNDAIYWGSPSSYATLSAYVITPVSSSSTLVWEFWNGSAWTSFTPSGIGFGAAGPGAVTFGTLTGWASTTVNGVNAFWVRLRISALGGGTTAGVWRQMRRGPQQWGPTIIGNTRLSSTYNDIYARWAIGNLNGSYGYSTTTFGAAFGAESGANITIDATNGIRFRNSTTTTLSMTNAELNLQNTGVIKSGSALALDTGAGIWLAANAGTPQFRIGDPTADRLRWDGTNLTLTSTNLTINTSGVRIVPATFFSGSRSYGFTTTTGDLGLYATDPDGGGRRASVQSTWTGSGNYAAGPALISELIAANTPSSGGTSKTASIRAVADTSSGVNTFTLIDSDYTQFGTDLRIYQNNGSTTSLPFMRSDGNYLVINSRSNANGGALYLQQDVAGDIYLGVGGGTQFHYGTRFMNPPKWDNALSQTTVGAAGAASALPANPVAYIKIADQSGNVFVVPAYNP